MSRFLWGLIFWAVVLGLVWPDTLGNAFSEIALDFIKFIFTLLVDLIGFLIALVVVVALGIGAVGLIGWMLYFLIMLMLEKRRSKKAKTTSENSRKENAKGSQGGEQNRNYQSQSDHASQEPPKTPPKGWQVVNRADALQVLDLAEPFTQAELKARWRSMLKQTHPDQGGSTLMVRLVNEAYQYLKQAHH